MLGVNLDGVWVALGLVLMIEGVLPFATPRVWRRMFSLAMQLNDGQVRFLGLVCIFLGLSVLWITL